MESEGKGRRWREREGGGERVGENEGKERERKAVERRKEREREETRDKEKVRNTIPFVYPILATFNPKLISSIFKLSSLDIEYKLV